MHNGTSTLPSGNSFLPCLKTFLHSCLSSIPLETPDHPPPCPGYHNLQFTPLLDNPEVTGTSSPNSCPQTTTPLFTVLCTTAFPVPCTLSRTDPKVCSDYPQISRAPIPTPAPLHTLFAELKSPPFPPTADRRLVHLWLP